MRIGVYNQFWSTLGGGEQYAGSIAEALAHRYDVSLLTPSSGGLDADLLFDRLSVDLRGLPIRELTPEAFPVSAASLDYDVFINVSFQSGAFNLAPTGVYVAHFPSEGFTLRQRAGAVARALRLGAADPSLRSLGGLKRAKGRRRGWVVEGQALLQVTSARPTELGIALDAGTSASTRLRIVAGRTIVDERLIDGDATVDVTLPAAVALSVFLIADTQGEGQGLHVPLLIERIALDGQPIDPLKATLRQRLAPLPPRAFLDSYDQIVANSGFTREWIGRRWGRDASVLHPPVRMRAGGDKEQLIVSVGRFFAEHAGHSKKQLEMVRAFRHLVERGLSGWRLVLIGGCSAEHRDYAMAVKREAIGLPVEVRLNAPGEV
ncbi:MAG TPA: hypothetical protein VG478_04730, partial [Acidimicrobiales bacterium]|nr:hypothetical protein [Acidimicrobiales bacterium]